MTSQDIDWSAVLGPLLGPVEGLHPNAFAEFVRASSGHAPRAIRLHPLAPASPPFETRPVPWFRRGRIVEQSHVLPGSYLQHAAGDYYVQDAGSMLALELCQAQPGQFIVDVCAAPGGKSTGLLESMDGQGCLLANEVIASRFSILQWTLERSGYANFLLSRMDTDRLSEVIECQCDCVLVDAPCTGQSMVARGKQSLAAYSPRQIEHSAARQMRILEAAAKMVNANGRLVYSTCTFSFLENEQIIFRFLERNPGWQLRSFPHLAVWESPVLPGSYRLWPHRDPSSGAFAAALVRCETSATEAIVSSVDTAAEPAARTSSRRSKRGRTDSNSVDERRSLPGTHLLDEANYCLLQRDENVLQLAPKLAPASWLAASLGGTRLAERRSSHWLPCFGSARLQSGILGVSPGLSLEDAQACRYVAGETIPLEELSSTACLSDWCIVEWKGRALAWGKKSAGVLKNHFPKLFRQANAFIGKEA